MQPQDIALYTGITLTVLNIFDRVSILKEKAKSHYKDHENRITHLEDESTQLRRQLTNQKTDCSTLSGRLFYRKENENERNKKEIYHRILGEV